jgi:hypothetical protein
VSLVSQEILREEWSRMDDRPFWANMIAISLPRSISHYNRLALSWCIGNFRISHRREVSVPYQSGKASISLGLR